MDETLNRWWAVQGRRIVAGAALVATAASPGAAQLRAALDIAGGEVGFGAVPAASLIVDGRLQWDAGWFSAFADARTAQPGRRAPSVHGRAELALRPPLGGGFAGELVFGAGSTNHHDFYRGRRIGGSLGGTFTGARGDVALRGAAAALRRLGDEVTARRIEIEASREFGVALVSIAGGRTSFADRGPVSRDTTYIVGGFPFHSQYSVEAIVSRWYADAEAAVDWRIKGSRWAAAVGIRSGDSRTPYERWQRVDVALPLTRQVDLLASAGRHPSVPEERLPGGSYVAVGLGFALRGAAVQGRLIPPAEGARFVALNVGGGRYSLTIVGLVGREVELMADFTTWEAIALTSLRNGIWSATLPLDPGAHRVVIRTDGGAWAPPAGLPVAADEFLGSVGILLIEP